MVPTWQFHSSSSFGTNITISFLFHRLLLPHLIKQYFQWYNPDDVRISTNINGQWLTFIWNALWLTIVRSREIPIGNVHVFSIVCDSWARGNRVRKSVYCSWVKHAKLAVRLKDPRLKQSRLKLHQISSNQSCVQNNVKSAHNFCQKDLVHRLLRLVNIQH